MVFISKTQVGAIVLGTSPLKVELEVVLGFAACHRLCPPTPIALLRNVSSRRGQCARDEMLVAQRDMEQGATAWNMQPFVTVGDEKVRLCGLEIDVDHTNALGAIDKAEDVEITAGSDHPLPGENDAGVGRDGIKHGHLGSLAVRLELLDGFAEDVDDFVIL